MNRFKIAADHPVRRRLFEFDDAEEASIDNFANVLQEEANRVNNEKKEKWNFDFENEMPLEGPIEWMLCDGPLTYTGRVRSVGDDFKINSDIVGEKEMDVDEKNSTLRDRDEEFYEESAQLLQKENEVTPEKKKCNEEQEDTILLTMERRRGDTTEYKTGNFCNDKSVRRNIHFE